MDYSPSHLAHQPLGEIACSYLDDFGWTLFPLYKKKPLGKWGHLQTYRPDCRELLEMFDHPRADGIALVHGPVSEGIVVRDFDFVSSYEQWKEKHKALARSLPTVRTGRGYHVFFQGPLIDNPSPNWKYTNGEYRSKTGMYTAIPRTLHDKTNKPYIWIIQPTAKGFPRVDDPWAVGLARRWPDDPGVSSGDTYVIDSSKEDSPTVQQDTFCQQEQDTDNHQQANNSTLIPHRCLQRRHLGLLGDSAPDPVVRANGRIRTWLCPEEVEEVAEKHKPTRQGERHRRLFDFVRELKGLKEISWDKWKLSRAFLLWWIRAEQTVSTKDMMASWKEFCVDWKECTSALKALDSDRLRETSGKIDLPEEAKKLRRSVRLLLKACIELQRYHGEEPFYLSYLSAGKIIDEVERIVPVDDPERLAMMRKEKGRKAMKTLLDKKWLERITTGNNYERQASRYRYCPSGGMQQENRQL